MKDQMPLLTVIVPCYNVQQYLRPCLDSLVRQNLKIVVVNDGSTDATGEIAREYASRYPVGLRLLEQENRGLGAARNAGLALADTEYVTFLDSDDWQDCRFAEQVSAALNRYPVRPDIIFTLPHIWDDATRRVLPWKDTALFTQLFYPREEGDSRILTAREAPLLYSLEVSACRKLFRLDFLKEISFSFPEGVKWEDVQPHFLTLHRAKSCAGLRETGFIYRVNTGRQITADGGSGRLDMVPVFRGVLELARREGWSREELRQITAMFCRFFQWSVGQANADVVLPLLRQLHGLAKEIPLYCYTAHGKKNALTLCLLASPFYAILKDYRIRELGKGMRKRHG